MSDKYLIAAVKFFSDSNRKQLINIKKRFSVFIKKNYNPIIYHRTKNEIDSNCSKLLNKSLPSTVKIVKMKNRESERAAFRSSNFYE